VALDDDRPYWERHYGIMHGPPNRRAWRRLGLAFVAALVIVVAVVVVGALVMA
jgi:hypothetical protein